jgi:type IV pilus assembly protein PilC
MVSELRPDRALILSRPKGAGLVVEGCYGLEPDHVLTGGPVSMTVFSLVFDKATPLWTADARRHPELKDSFSLQVSEILSVVSAPLFHPEEGVSAILYADRKIRSAAFNHEDIQWLVSCARQLEEAIFGQRAFQSPQRLTSSRRRAMQTVRRAEGPAGLKGTPKSRSVIVFLRSLAAMMNVGVPLGDAFSTLSQHSDDTAMTAVVADLGRRVLGGRPLSKAMQSHPRVFSAFQVEMARTGEQTGRLVTVLELLATQGEKSQALELRLRSALVYPGLVLMLCLLGTLTFPPLLLRGQLEFLAQAGVALPLLTRMVMGLCQMVSSPLFWVMLLALALGLSRLKGLAGWLRRGAYGWPGVSWLMMQVSQLRLCRSLRLSQRAGLSLLPALEQSLRVSGDPHLLARLPEVREVVMAGGTLAEALARSGRFDKTFLAMVRVGEEAGSLEASMQGLEQLLEVQLDSAIEQLMGMLEPVLMLLVGVLVGLFVLAGFMPTMSLIQTL